MLLTPHQQDLLSGSDGPATQKAMQILVALGQIYGAAQMAPVSSVQVSGVSYDNLGEAGLEFLQELAEGGGRAQVFTTLNPAGVDPDNAPALGIPADFARDQQRVLQAFDRMGVTTTCSCTPYLFGNLPHYGEHIAWAESSAVCYANSVLGARTNREGGPSALAAALTGFTPACGYHLDENRQPTLTVEVRTSIYGTSQFGALGYAVGHFMERLGSRPVPYLRGLPSASLEELKSFCASLATFGGAAFFHMEGITPEAALHAPPETTLTITAAEIEAAIAALNDAALEEVDFVSLGCPHLSLAEIGHLAELLRGRTVQRTFWITTSRPVKGMADRMGYSSIIEAAGAVFATDTCCVVAPIRGRFHALATDSAKACYYAASKNRFKTLFLPFDDVVEAALQPVRPAGAGFQCPLQPPEPPVTAPALKAAEAPSTPALVVNRKPGAEKLSLSGRCISPGVAEGLALSTSLGISFYGGIDPDTGCILEKGHPLEGQSIAGRVLVFSTGKGSTVGSYTLYRLQKAGLAPAAILNVACETITAVGCIISGIPCVDQLSIDQIPSGAYVRVDAASGKVEVNGR